MAKSLILNIPYSSSYVPVKDEPKFLPHPRCCCFAQALQNRLKENEVKEERRKLIEKELFTFTDWYTDELFDLSIGKAIIAPVSRLICDTERNYLDSEEPEAKNGMGFCYEKDLEGKLIKEFDDDYKTDVLFRYYAPHQIALNDAIEESLSKNFEALLINCHSFQDFFLAPDFFLYTDDVNTPKELKEGVKKFLKERGYSVGCKKGARVPAKFKGKEVFGVLTISVNRKLYLKPRTNEKSDGFIKLQKTLRELELALDLGDLQY